MSNLSTILDYFASLPGVKADWKRDVAPDHHVPALLEKLEVVEAKVVEEIKELVGAQQDAVEAVESAESAPVGTEQAPTDAEEPAEASTDSTAAPQQ